MICPQCTDDKSKTLIDGQKCCTWCSQHMLECEARALLKLPLSERREALTARYKTRGNQAVENLKDKMQKIHELRKRVAEKSMMREN